MHTLTVIHTDPESRDLPDRPSHLIWSNVVNKMPIV